MFSKASFNHSRDDRTMHMLAILLATLLFANLAFGIAWAKGDEKEGKGNHDKKDHKEKSDKDEGKSKEGKGNDKNESQDEKSDESRKGKSDEKQEKNEKAKENENESKSKDANDQDGKKEDKSDDRQGKEQKSNTNQDELRENKSDDSKKGENDNNGPNKSTAEPRETSGSSEGADSNAGSPASPPQSPVEPPIPLPVELEVSLNDSVTTADSFDMSTGFGRSIPDSISLEETGQTELMIAVPALSESAIQQTEAQETPDRPIITVTSPRVLHISGEQEAEISFRSNVDGQYTIVIRSDEDDSAQTLTGRMFEGINSVLWDGKDAAGTSVPDGEYRYFILAESEGGLRAPPPSGDGIIIVEASVALAPVNANLVLLVVLAAIAAGLATFFFIRRRSTTIFVPAEAAAIIDDVRDRYPKAVVANYVESNGDLMDSYVGITIPKDADKEWLAEIAERANEITNTEPIKQSHRDHTDAA